MKQIIINRGDIALVNLEPTIGSETKKTRPAIVISNELINAHSKVIIIAPITSNVKKIYPFEHKIATGLKVEGKIMLDQMRSVDRSRLIKKLEELPPDELRLVDEIIKHVIGVQ